MNIFGQSPYVVLLRRELGSDWTKFLIMATLTGISDGAVVAVINASAASSQTGKLNLQYLVMFLACIGFHILAKNYLLTRSGFAVEQMVHRIRLRIANKLRHMELGAFDKLGKAEIQLRLSQDTITLASSALPIFNAMGAAVMLIFCGAYIAYLSLAAFIVTIGLIVMGATYYINSRMNIQDDLMRAVTTESRFFAVLEQILSGFKEVKMSSKRSDDLFKNHLTMTAEETLDAKSRSHELFVKNFVFSQVFFYQIIAVIAFLLPAFELTSGSAVREMTSVILFTFSPLGELIMTLTQVARLNIAVESLNRLEAQLTVAEPDLQALSYIRLSDLEQLDTLSLKGVQYSYTDATGEAQFQIGPIDLTFRRGEIVFIVGGNGSGKSTFLKVLSGLYTPSMGSIQVNEIGVDRNNVAVYRDHFATIFSDFHLFDQLYGIDDLNEEEATKLLVQFELQTKTAVREGRFTTTELSTGQRKRLALISALLEKKQIYVLDEVAADQDPVFKARFYHEILPQLRDAQKFVIVVSHDDQYFDVADHVYRMDYGKLQPLSRKRKRKTGG